MTNIIEFATFTLKEGVSIPDFLLISDKFNNEFLSLQKGYISRKLLFSNKMWSDLVVWKTMEDAQNAVKEFYKSAAAMEYASFMNEDNGELLHFSVKKSY
jgi:hypothetical protein